MNIQVKYKTVRGGWKFVKCPCCEKKRLFPSWKQAKEYVNSRSHIVNWRMQRV